MPLLEIVTLENPILREKVAPVTVFDETLQQLIDNMVETMRAAPGVGLAAPQVNQNLQLTVIETIPELDEQGEPIPDTQQLIVLINPEVSWVSRDMRIGVEGCLSLPGWVGEVARHAAIRVKAQDRHGRPVKLTAAGWNARIFQHEIDHLNGVLYIDRLTAPENFWTEKEYAAMSDDDDEHETSPTKERIERNK